MMTPRDESGADAVVARAQQSAEKQQRAALVKQLTDAGVCARMFAVACEAQQHGAFAKMVNDWGRVMLQAAKVLNEDP